MTSYQISSGIFSTLFRLNVSSLSINQEDRDVWDGWASHRGRIGSSLLWKKEEDDEYGYVAQDVNKLKTCSCLLTSWVSTEASSGWRYTSGFFYTVLAREVILILLTLHEWSVNNVVSWSVKVRVVGTEDCSVCAICYERKAGRGWSGLTCLAITFPAAANFASDLETTFSESHGFWMSSNLVSLVFR